MLPHTLLRQMLLALGATAFALAAQAETVRVAHVTDLSGPLAAYAQQLATGLDLGFEYATKGTMEVAGSKIEVIRKDSQGDPARARAMVEEAYAEDNANLVVGPVASGVALATLPIAEEYERPIMPEGVADAITGSSWNPYVIRIGRNSSQDAVSNAVALGKPGVCVATIAQDYAFGRDGVAAYKKAMDATGGKIVHEEYLPTDASDFTAAAERLFGSLRDRSDCAQGKYIFAIWAGSVNPLARIQDLQPQRYNIKLAAGGNILPVLASYTGLEGMEGAGFYYFETFKNPANDWLVKEHFARLKAAPDFFTAQGFAQAMAIVAALEKSGGKGDSQSLMAAFRGLTFDTPKGQMQIRPEDGQALQDMFHFRIKVEERDNWFADRKGMVGVPELVRVIGRNEMDIPLLNKK